MYKVCIFGQFVFSIFKQSTDTHKHIDTNTYVNTFRCPHTAGCTKSLLAGLLAINKVKLLGQALASDIMHHKPSLPLFLCSMCEKAWQYG